MPKTRGMFLQRGLNKALLQTEALGLNCKKFAIKLAIPTMQNWQRMFMHLSLNQASIALTH